MNIPRGMSPNWFPMCMRSIVSCNSRLAVHEINTCTHVLKCSIPNTKIITYTCIYIYHDKRSTLAHVIEGIYQHWAEGFLTEKRVIASLSHTWAKSLVHIFLLALRCDRKCIWNDLDACSYVCPNHFICTSGHNAMQAKKIWTRLKSFTSTLHCVICTLLCSFTFFGWNLTIIRR